MKNRLGLPEEKRIEDKIIINIKNLFNKKKKMKQVNISGVTIILNKKVMVIEIKHYQLNNS